MDIPVDRIVVYDKGKPIARGRANRLGQVWRDDGTFYDTLMAFSQDVYRDNTKSIFDEWLPMLKRSTSRFQGLSGFR